MNNKALVVKDNRLIEASYTLGLIEQRIVLMAIAWARQNDIELSSDTWVELRARDYSALYGVDLEVSYKQLSAACEELQHRQIKIVGVDRMTRAPAVYVSKWVTSAIYVKDIGVVRLQFNAMLVPYVSDLDSHFTSYSLGSVSGLSSTYAIRLYELLTQYKKIGERVLMIGDLKDYLECDLPAYARIDNFKTRVIDVAVRQINALTDITCEYKHEKLGKRVVGFCFKIKIKEPPKAMRNAKKINFSPNHAMSPIQDLSISELAMLRDLQAKYPDLTEKEVIQMAKDQQKDVFMVLHGIGQNGLV